MRDTIILRPSKSDPAGAFTFVAPERVKEGIYPSLPRLPDERGAHSESAKLILVAVERSWFWKLTSLLSSYFPGFDTTGWIAGYRLYTLYVPVEEFPQLKAHLRQEVSDTEAVLHQVFDKLRKDTRKQIKLLEKTRFDAN